MELYQLRYFARAAAYENISMAAQDLHVTQPSISKAVKALEKELQVELMRRNGKYCELTHEGRRFQARILPVLAELDEIPAEIQNRRARKQIRVNVLSASFMMPSLKKIQRDSSGRFFHASGPEGGDQLGHLYPQYASRGVFQQCCKTHG